MRSDFKCPHCQKITEGDYYDEWWEYIDELAINYQTVFCNECEKHFDIITKYKIWLEFESVECAVSH